MTDTPKDDVETTTTEEALKTINETEEDILLRMRRMEDQVVQVNKRIDTLVQGTRDEVSELRKEVSDSRTSQVEIKTEMRALRKDIQQAASRNSRMFIYLGIFATLVNGAIKYFTAVPH